MSRQFQYQELTEPVIGAEPHAFVGPSANQPWSDPIQLSIKVISTALIASQVLSFVPPVRAGNDWHETVTESRWHQPWSEPVRVAPRDAWFQPDILTRTASDVTGIKYLPLSEPVRVPPRSTDFPALAFVPIVQQDLVTSWYVPLSEPVRAKPIDAWFQEYTKGTQPAVSFSYYEPLVDPVRVLPRDVWFQPDTLTRTASDVTGIKYAPLSEPVRSALRAPWYQDETFQFVAQTAAPADSWLPVFPDSAPAAARASWYQDLAFYPLPLPNATLPPDTWLPVFPDIVPAAARTAWYQDLALYPLPIPATPIINVVVATGSWSQPTQTVTLQYQATTATSFNPFPLPNPPPTVPSGSWSQPTQTATLQYQGLALVRAASDVIGIQYLPLSEPVRTPLRDAWYQDATSISPFPLPNATTPPLSWGPFFPDTAPAAARVVYNQELAFVVGAVVPTPITSLQSWEPWADPPPPLTIIALREGWPTYIDSVDNAQPDTGKVWRRYWIQDDPNHILNRDAPHDLVWADEDDVITVLLL